MKLSNVRFDASSSPLFNGENLTSLSYFYQQLFKKYSPPFSKMSVNATVTYANKIDLIEILLLWF
jgi:hypothetical protein